MATATGVEIVEARPEHAPFLAWVSLAAFRSHLPRGMWDFLIGGTDEEMLRYLEALMLTEQKHWCHHSIFIIAEVDGTPAAALSGYFQDEHGGDRLREAMLTVDRLIPRAVDPELLQQGLTIANIVPDHPERAWIVENVATLPEFRRRGLIDRLMADIVERGRRRGATVSDISVFIGNDAAQRAYEKAGYVAVAEKRDAAFEAAYGSPGTRTLRRRL
jgi:ribosomal protein S18 acetylase RimI-like enzyme